MASGGVQVTRRAFVLAVDAQASNTAVRDRVNELAALVEPWPANTAEFRLLGTEAVLVDGVFGCGASLNAQTRARVETQLASALPWAQVTWYSDSPTVAAMETRLALRAGQLGDESYALVRYGTPLPAAPGALVWAPTR